MKVNSINNRMLDFIFLFQVNLYHFFRKLKLITKIVKQSTHNTDFTKLNMSLLEDLVTTSNIYIAF